MSELKPLVLSALKPPMNVVLVQDAEGLEKLKVFLDSTKGGVIGLDTETNWCGDFFFRKVRTVQIGNKEQQFVIDLLAFAGSSENLSNNQGYYKLHECFKPVIDVLKPALCSN